MNEHEIYDYDDTLAITNTRRKQLEEEALAHHGILGMKWGIRRYQNEDGSLTELGQRHYDMLERKQELEYGRRNRKEEADVERQRLKYQRASEKQGLYNQRDRDVYDFANQERERKLHRKNVLTVVAVGALAVGGGIALHNYLKNKGNTPIDAPELTTTISTGRDNVQKLLFNTSGISNGTANYNFGGSGKNASTFGQTKIDDLKKLMDSSSKPKTLSKGRIKIENLAKKGNWGVDADNKQDVLEKLDSFTSFKKPVSISRNGKWEADNGTVSDLSNILAKRRQAQFNSNTAADMLSKQRAFERRKKLAGQIFEPGVRADKKGDVNWKKLAYRSGMKIPEGNDIFSYVEKMTNPSISRSTSTSTPVDLLARKAAYDTAVNNLGSNLDKTLKKFKHSNIGDAYDMIDSKLMHTAIAISNRRRAQLETRDDYLMHYGRKGMKWGEDVYAEDELKKRQSRSVDPNQYAQQLLAEANRRKQNHQNTSLPGYGDGTPLTQNTSNPGYGDGVSLTQNTSLPGYGDGVLLNTDKKSTSKVEPRQKHDPTINIRGKQVSTEDIEKQKNKSDMEKLAQDTAQTIDNVNKGNTGNGTVDALINAKNNRYKMLYDMVVPTKETNKTENRRLDTANAEPHLKRDLAVNGKEKQISTENVENQKNESDMEDLAKDTAQAIDNVNKGNTGNNVVDTLINAKNNRYKMMYDLVVPTKETNKTENRRLDTANESGSSSDKLKKKLKV